MRVGIQFHGSQLDSISTMESMEFECHGVQPNMPLGHTPSVTTQNTRYVDRRYWPDRVNQSSED